ncbi:hypothetical protein [Streptomyces sp. NPDC101776]|uniref:hypothetical protein n=1 Tax=Streptomyces sp. NPDC101776 TaxID=3366146 RepID=UPI0038134B27
MTGTAKPDADMATRPAGTVSRRAASAAPPATCATPSPAPCRRTEARTRSSTPHITRPLRRPLQTRAGHLCAAFRARLPGPAAGVAEERPEPDQHAADGLTTGAPVAGGPPGR